MALETSKNLGGVGAILIVIGTIGLSVPYAGLLALIGLIIMLIGLKGLADYYREGGIFNNALYALIIAIVGGVVAIGVLVATALAALADIGIDLANVTDWASFGTQLTDKFTNVTDFSAILTLIGAVVASLIILFVFAIIAAFFFRRSLTTLSSKAGVGLFGTAGLLMLIGAVLTIIVIGFLLMWIAMILVAIAFFQIRAQPTQAAPPPPVTT